MQNKARCKVILFTFALILVLQFFCNAVARADFEQRMNYQGRLTDSNGIPVADGLYSMVFEICTDSSCTTVVWTEAHTAGNAVTTEDGLFSVILGGITTLTTLDFNSTEYYIQVSIGATTFSPPQRLTAVAMALNVRDSSITSAKVLDNTLTAADLNVNVVSSIDGQIVDGGNIDLVAGSGISISPGVPAAGQITIAASGGGIDHGSLAGLTPDNDHPQYVLDAGDTMTGPLLMSGTNGDITFNNTSGVISNSAGAVQVGDDLNVTGSLTVSGTVDTGQGATEVYLMNQNLRTTDNVSFVNVTSTGNFIGDIQVDDTRSVNEPPTSFDKEVSFDFKNRATVGVGGSGTYSGMLTIAPWGDNSGDASHQLNFNEGGIFWRQGQPDSASWGTWYQIGYSQNQDDRYVNVTGDTMTGELITPSLIAPAAGYSSGAPIDVGSVSVNYPGNSGWAGSWNSNILLSGLDSSSISFHDSGSRVDTLRVAGGNFYIGENVGWGVASLTVGGNLTVPGVSTIGSIYLNQDATRDTTNYSTITSTPNLHLDSKEGYSIYLDWYGGGGGVRIGNGAGDDTGALYAGILYDGNDTSRYVDPTGNTYLNRLVSVDNSIMVTNLNADMLDGKHYSDATGDFVNISGDTMTGRLGQSASGFHVATKDDITTRTDSGFFQTSSATTGEGWPESSNSWYHLLTSTHSNDSNYYSMQFAADFFDSNDLFYRSTNGSGSTGWNRIWHSGNDGAGSGIDADLLDGYNSPQLGNFGNWQAHGTFTDCNTNPSYWGWNYVQGTANCPNTISSQWYRGNFSLGSNYPMRGSGGYSLEIAYPRSNHASAGVWMRTVESGTIGSWTRIGACISVRFTVNTTTNCPYGMAVLAAQNLNEELKNPNDFTATPTDGAMWCCPAAVPFVNY